MNALNWLLALDVTVLVLMTLSYFYQAIYTFIGLIKRRQVEETPKHPIKMGRYAALICARNEETVIGQLVKSLKKQKYPNELLDIYVLADNCTDETAQAAKQAGALVYVRHNNEQVGKGFALDYLLKNIAKDRSDSYYDGYFIFDADNLVDPMFVRSMNQTINKGYEVVTCYRNSKNFGANWISASYSIWFLREARFLNFPRMLTGNSCAVSGTGFYVASNVVRANNGWPFHLLTEDIQFSADCIIKGRVIGYCDNAVIFDEQPTSFSQSWKQRMRWAKGFFQVDAHYMGPLLKNIFSDRRGRMSCYDFFMTIAPATFLTLFAIAFNIVLLVDLTLSPTLLHYLVAAEAIRYLEFAAINYYLGMVFYALLTVISEWHHIRATSFEKVKYIWLFPIFMLTYVPITFIALFKKVGWSHIQHYAAKETPLTK